MIIDSAKIMRNSHKNNYGWFSRSGSHNFADYIRTLEERFDKKKLKKDVGLSGKALSTD